MALFYADGFDHWGSFAIMQTAGWFDVSFGGRTNVSINNARTGTNSLQINASDGNGQGAGAFHLVGGARTNLGMGIAYYLSNLPTQNNSIGWAFIDGSFATCFRVAVSSAGELMIYDSGNTLRATSAVGIVKPTSYSYLEIQSIINGGTGLATVTVKQNGQLVVAALNIAGGASYGGIYLGKYGTNFATPQINFDDYVLWDTSGVDNNAFLGDRRCFTSFTSADTAFASWLPNAGGVGYSRINNVPANDASYITAQNVGDISEFQKNLITVATTSVAGVVIFGRGAKTDAGTCTFRLGIHSASFVSNSAAFAPGTGFAYYSTIFERDPNGNIPWTKAAVDAATVRLTRDS